MEEHNPEKRRMCRADLFASMIPRYCKKLALLPFSIKASTTDSGSANEGSNPSRATKYYIGVWCNGSINGSNPFGMGSNPVAPAIFI